MSVSMYIYALRGFVYGRRLDVLCHKEVVR